MERGRERGREGGRKRQKNICVGEWLQSRHSGDRAGRNGSMARRGGGQDRTGQDRTGQDRIGQDSRQQKVGKEAPIKAIT